MKREENIRSYDEDYKIAYFDYFPMLSHIKKAQSIEQ